LKWIARLSLLALSLQALSASEELALRRIQAHLLLNEVEKGIVQAETALQYYPDSNALWEAYLGALSKQNNPLRLLNAWQQLRNKDAEAACKSSLCEVMAWGVIGREAHNSAPYVRLMALLAAYLAQDAQGVKLVYRGLFDEHYAVRAVAAKIAGEMRDPLLQEGVWKRLQEEKKWAVKLELIEAAGAMQLKKAQPLLLDLLQNDEASDIQKVAAKALAAIKKKISPKELDCLIHS
jgi:HEAT repeat protein